MSADGEVKQMRARALPSVETIKKVLAYDEKTGEFRWLPRNDRSHVMAGTLAGCFNPRGYCLIVILGSRYFAHRLAWKYVHGVDPTDKIDHINGNPSDNRIANLRCCSQSQNLANRRKNSRSSPAPFKGVTKIQQRRGEAYSASVCAQGVKYFLGNFLTPEAASAAYLAKAKELFGEFANVG